MKLRIREIFRTFQGEGSRVGEPAVFVRFTGCNLWSGLEDGRGNGRGHCAQWCDTDFATGEEYSVDDALTTIEVVGLEWELPLIVLTGGEPMLQLRKPAGKVFVAALHARGYAVALETNGTIEIPEDIAFDHVTVSPKPLLGPGIEDTAHIKVRKGDDLKVIWPTPFDVSKLSRLAVGFDNTYLQPMDPMVATERSDPLINLPDTLEAAGKLGWRVSLQTHKLAGLP